MNFWRQRKQRKALRKFRDAVATFRHNDDDILSGEQKSSLDGLLADTCAALRESALRPEFPAEAAARFRQIAPPPKYRALREWLDIIAVVAAVAFGIRGLFLQPFKIPTSSMQPTLYGIHFMERENRSNPLLGRLPSPLDFLLFSARPASLTIAGVGGRLDPDSFQVAGNALFDSLAFRIGDRRYTLPGAPEKVAEYSGIGSDLYKFYAPGEKVSDGFLSLGDHLFVDRVGFNLTGLRRGDIVVFNTEGIVSGDGHRLMEQSGYYYVKRLVGLPGDTLRIADRQLWVRPAGETQFRRIQELAPVFRKLYSGKGGYQGHANSPGEGNFSYFLQTPEAEFTVPPDRYFMLGDNTKFSSDSRIWGTVPRRNIVGRPLVVFWPFSRRWGMVDRSEPVDVPTGESVRGTFPSMYLQ